MKTIVLISLILSGQTYAMQSELNLTLIKAVKAADLSSIQRALKNGADPNVSHDGWTALLWAACIGHTSTVKLLISAGASINCKSPYGATALILASYHGHIQTAKLLALLADINLSCTDGKTALMSATSSQNLEIVQLLLAQGADVNAQDVVGFTALDLAQKGRNGFIVQVLDAIERFLENPVEQIDAHPENKKDYFVWSIAYKKDEAYDYLANQLPDLGATTKTLIHHFLLSARVGNAHVFNSLKNILRERKPEGVKFVYLKSCDIIMKLHPELLYLVHQVLAEDIAPTAHLVHVIDASECQNFSE